MDTSDLVSRLRSELASSAEEPAVPGGLFAAAQRRARRRTRRRRALVSILGSVFVVGVAIGTIRWSGESSPTDVATGPPGAEHDSSPDVSAEGAGILLAVRPNNPGFAVVDLDDGAISEYPPGSHSLPEGGVAGMAVTARGDAVVWQYDGVLRLVPDADFSQTPLEIAPTSVRYDPEYATTFQVVPSPDGSRLWIIQPALPGETTSLVDLVDAITGANIAATEVALSFDPVGATEDSLIVNTEEPDPDDQRVVSLDIDGTIHEVATDAVGVAVYGDIIATVDPSGDNLSLVDMKEDREVRVEAPTPGRWVTLGDATIPSDSGPFPVVSPEGELLVEIGRGDLDIGDYVSTLYAVSMVDGTSRPLTDFEGQGAAAVTWSRDGDDVVIVENTGLPDYDVYTVAMLDPETSEREATVVAELEADYFPLAAG